MSQRLRLASIVGSTCLVTLAIGSTPAPAPAGQPHVGELRRSGTVSLEISCKPEVRQDFQTALALLHSFFYEEARNRFQDIARRDPQCAIARWGAAMTEYHPLWAPPTAEELARGAEAAAQAKALGGNELERGLVAALDAYFNAEEKPTAPGAPVAQSCHGPRTSGSRAEAFRASLERLHAARPNDVDVTAFYALALLGTAPPTDKTYKNQLAATALLEPLFEKYPDHPGIPHYIIHAYDYPSLAQRGLVAARRYGDIAPWVPHALHMPSHIYTRLGMWSDSIASNLTSANASRDYTTKIKNGDVWYDELHALDYVMFAYLQTAQDRKAEELLAYVRGIEGFHQPNFAAAYALGAIPARWALERGRWQDAAELQVLHPKIVEPFPFAAAHTEFARAVGSARSGRIDGARAAVERLAALRQSLEVPKFQWWVDQIEIQRLAAAAWLARAEKDDAGALRLLGEAAALEDRAGTHPVTPGQILPAREQLGDVLMELGRPADALAEYERALEAFPNRFRAHHGAARAAEAAGKPDVARKHFEHLIELAGDGDGRRDVLEHARRYLAGERLAEVN